MSGNGARAALAIARSVNPAMREKVIPAAPTRRVLPHQQVRDQVAGGPAAAQGRGVGAEGQGGVAEGVPLAADQGVGSRPRR